MVRKIGRGKITIAVLLAVVAVMGIALASFLVTRTTHFTGHVGTHGNIQLFADVACTLPYNGTDFGEFAVLNERHQIQFFLKNTGNVRVNLTYTFFNGQEWSLIPDSVCWTDGLWQTYVQGSIMENWYATNATVPIELKTVTLAVGQVADIYVILTAMQTGPATADFNYLFSAVDA